MAITLAVGGTVLGAMFAPATAACLAAWVSLWECWEPPSRSVFAVVAALAGYGVWTFREWGRILCIVLAGITVLLSLPGLLFMGLHFGFFLGGYRVIKLAINVLIIWYLVQPQVMSLFQRSSARAAVI